VNGLDFFLNRAYSRGTRHSYRFLWELLLLQEAC
jgi:hypothetical protein